MITTRTAMDVDTHAEHAPSLTAAVPHTAPQHDHQHAQVEAGASSTPDDSSSPQLAVVGAVEPLPPAARLTGTVKSYNGQKRYGFIVSDYDGQEYFIHASRLEDKRVLVAGQRVTFDLEWSSKRCKMQCTRCKAVGGSEVEGHLGRVLASEPPGGPNHSMVHISGAAVRGESLCSAAGSGAGRGESLWLALEHPSVHIKGAREMENSPGAAVRARVGLLGRRFWGWPGRVAQVGL